MIFIDTGAFLARYVKQDQYHPMAIQQWQQLRHARQRCYTTNFVLNETFTLLARRTDYGFAADRAQLLLQSRILVILRPDQTDEQSAVDLFRKFGDHQVSFTDCISFVLMRKHGLRHAFTFDRHFQYAGFVIEPAVSI
jgi:predicted nucleic acid-binding protein